MKMPEKRKVTLMLDTDVYHGLKLKVGSRGMGDFMSRIIRPHVVLSSLEESYRELSRNGESNKISLEWEGSDGVIEAENIWRQ